MSNTREKTINYFNDLDTFARKELKYHGIKRNCPICGIDNQDIALPKAKYVFVKCKKCGLTYIKNILPDTDTFYENNKKYEEGWRNTNIQKTKELDPQEKRILKSVKNRGNLLDIGCGFGRTLYHFKDYFGSVEGIELNEYISKIGRDLFGVKITKNIEALEDSSYDCIILHQVIEHLASFDLFKKVHKLLNKDGKVFIGCPFMDSLSMRILKQKHIHVQSIAHINMFNFKSFKAFAKKYGFKIESIKTDNNIDVRLSDFLCIKKGNFFHRHNRIRFNRFSSAIFLLTNFFLEKTNLLSKMKPGSYLEVVLVKE